MSVEPAVSLSGSGTLPLSEAKARIVDAAAAWRARSPEIRPHEELLQFARQLAADIASCDPKSVTTLLAHYRRLAGAASLSEAHLLEGLMAETWQAGTSLVRGRREEVTARGRAQAGTTGGTGSLPGPA